MTDDVRKLLGGYATGTLSEEEKELLYAAALTDDKLFAALADEEALREMLEDGAVRAQLLRATEEPKFSASAALWRWFEQPKSKAMVGTLAVLLVVIGVNALREKSTQPVQVAQAPQSAPVVEDRAQPQTSVPRPPPAPASAPAPGARKAGPLRQTPAREWKQEPEPVLLATPTAPAAPVAETQVAESRVANEAPPQAMIAAPARQAAGTAVTPLQYALLRREADGVFRPVPADYEFTPGDLIRVRLTSVREGPVSIAIDGQPPITGVISPNQLVVLPSAGIPVTPQLSKLSVTFLPASPGEVAASATGSVSGFTGGRMAKTLDAVAPRSVTIEIPLRVRNP